MSEEIAPVDHLARTPWRRTSVSARRESLDDADAEVGDHGMGAGGAAPSGWIA